MTSMSTSSCLASSGGASGASCKNDGGSNGSCNNNSGSNGSSDASPEKPTPARNLTQAFEALCGVQDEHKEDGGGGNLIIKTATGAPCSEGTASSTCSRVLDDDEGDDPTQVSSTASSATAAAETVKLALISPTGVAAELAASASASQAAAPNAPSSTKTAATGAGALNQQQQKVHRSPPPAPTPKASVVAATAAKGKTPATANTAATTKTPVPSGETQQEQQVTQPSLNLHPALRRDLSQALVNRVSFYAIIHDINKEASAMASDDPLQQQQQQQPQQNPPLPENEDKSPLVVAARGGDAATVQREAAATALIDEEEWLLSTIAARRETEEDRRACPDTFPQAMGEKEYENPVSSLAGNTRTQLWKPSRSWWEAKSGKNPWIEPASHNKRWRYLWPLIHYHKFLAKCIKKLKRNGVDVKQSVSPVAVFLREEVCSISDHLAALSLFDSDRWMACLGHFHGWTDPHSEQVYREAVARLQLRPLIEPSDVDSPLLRSQIDEHFLRTMATARAQLREVAPTERKKKPDGQPPVYPRGSPAVPKHIVPTSKDTDPQRPRHQQRYPYPTPPHHYPAGGQMHGWWNPHWDPSQQQQAQAANCDNSSVQSGLSADSSYPQPPPVAPPHYPYPMHNHPNPYYPYPPSSDESVSGYNSYGENAMYDPQAMQHGHPHGGWMDPAMLYAMQMQGYYPPHHHHHHSPHHHYNQHQHQRSSMPPPAPPLSSTPGVASSSNAPALNATTTTSELHSYSSSETPQKKPADFTQSPFWSHLDQATLAMGLATPAKSSPLTPRRVEGGLDAQQAAEQEQVYEEPSRSAANLELTDSSTNGDESGFACNAQPLLLQHGQYYGYNDGGGAGGAQYGTGGETGYGPPSPATQFMMSPQASFAYSYGYGFSPGRQNGRNTTTTPRANRKLPPSNIAGDSNNSKQSVAATTSPQLEETTAGTSGLTPPPAVRKLSPQVPTSERESPATVETSTESESLHETT